MFTTLSIVDGQPSQLSNYYASVQGIKRKKYELIYITRKNY